jgi:hypothetical protein
VGRLKVFGVTGLKGYYLPRSLQIDTAELANGIRLGSLLSFKSLSCPVPLEQTVHLFSNF